MGGSTKNEAGATAPAWLIYAPFAALAGIILVEVRVASHRLTNLDTYFHLRFGREFLEGNWSIWHPGTGTPFATAHWVPTQWSSQIVMAWFERTYGLDGVAWLYIAMVIVFTASLYLLARERGGALASLLPVGVAIYASAPALSARPQLVSFVLIAVVARAVIKSSQDGRSRWWLIPLFWFWATAHGMWPIGLSIVGVGAVGAILDERWRGPKALRAFAFPALCTAATAATPLGPSVYHAVLGVASRRDNFTEWQATDFTQAPNLALAMLIALVVVAALRRSQQARWLDVGLIATALFWGLYSERGVPAAATLLVPFAAQAIQSVLPSRPSPRREHVLVGGIAAIAMLLAALVASASGPKEIKEPSWLAGSMAALPQGTVVVDDQAFGAYLLWKYPQIAVVGDGYGDRYTDSELKRISELGATKPGWVEDLKATGAHWALLDPDVPLAYTLMTTQGWRVVHADPHLVLLEAPRG